MNPDETPAVSPSRANRCRLIVVGHQIAELLTSPGGFKEQADVVRHVPDFETWAANPGDETADLLLVECPTLFPDRVALIQERTTSARAARAIVVYHFSQDATVDSVERSNNSITALRAPLTPNDLKIACEADLALAAIRGQSPLRLTHGAGSDVDQSAEETDEIPQRQFSDLQLSKISKISTTVQCECPHHLVSLLTALNAFESYSHQCENRNADDATLHAFLHRRTAQARAMMEDALSILAEAEGIDTGL